MNLKFRLAILVSIILAVVRSLSLTLSKSSLSMAPKSVFNLQEFLAKYPAAAEEKITAFDQSVYEACCQIPAGKFIDYERKCFVLCIVTSVSLFVSFHWKEKSRHTKRLPKKLATEKLFVQLAPL
jgi:hypothetical protein